MILPSPQSQLIYIQLANLSLVDSQSSDLELLDNLYSGTTFLIN